MVIIHFRRKNFIIYLQQKILAILLAGLNMNDIREKMNENCFLKNAPRKDESQDIICVEQKRVIVHRKDVGLK